MIVDTSAVVAILFAEPDAERYALAIAGSGHCSMSAANYIETAIVVDVQTRAGGGRELDTFLRRAGIEIAPVTEEQAHLARQAYSDFGKGRHRAGLNYGDCFAYALSKASGEPLLYKGEDFGRTDVTSAL